MDRGGGEGIGHAGLPGHLDALVDRPQPDRTEPRPDPERGEAEHQQPAQHRRCRHQAAGGGRQRSRRHPGSPGQRLGIAICAGAQDPKHRIARERQAQQAREPEDDPLKPGRNRQRQGAPAVPFEGAEIPFEIDPVGTAGVDSGLVGSRRDQQPDHRLGEIVHMHGPERAGPDPRAQRQAGKAGEQPRARAARPADQRGSDDRPVERGIAASMVEQGVFLRGLRAQGRDRCLGKGADAGDQHEVRHPGRRGLVEQGGDAVGHPRRPVVVIGQMAGGDDDPLDTRQARRRALERGWMLEVVALVSAKRDHVMAEARKGGVDRPSDKTGAADEENAHGCRSP